MTQPLRRGVPRQPADWFGFYRFDNIWDENWRSCRVIDISPVGAGLELFDTTLGECMDGRITVSIELHGDTRNVVINEQNNTARVGVQFPTPSDVARRYVRSLSGIRSRW